MKPCHVATLVISCVTIGVLLSLVVQHRLSASKKERKSTAVTVLDPTLFSGSKTTLAPVVSAEEQGPQPATHVTPPVAKDAAPPGSGERWTPLK